MANRESIENAVLGYIPLSKREAAKPLVKSLVNPAVLSIGEEHPTWSYLRATKLDYTVSNSSRTITMPSTCKTIWYMGKMHSTDTPIMTSPIYPMTHRWLMDNYEKLYGYEDAVTDVVQPLHYFEIPGTRQFRIIGSINSSFTLGVVYHKRPDKIDLDLIDNELAIIFKMLFMLPTEYVSANSLYNQLYNKEIALMWLNQRKSREIPIVIHGGNPEHVKFNEYVRSIG